MKPKKQIFFRLVALLPLLSSALYFGMMPLGLAEGFTVVGVIVFALAVVGWGAVGAAFSRSNRTLGRALLSAHLFPIACVLLYAVLHGISLFAESSVLTDIADLIGVFGMGIFTLLSSMLYAVLPLELFEVYLNFAFYLIVFAVGYAVGTARRGTRAKKKRPRKSGANLR